MVHNNQSDVCLHCGFLRPISDPIRSVGSMRLDEGGVVDWGWRTVQLERGDVDGL